MLQRFVSQYNKIRQALLKIITKYKYLVSKYSIIIKKDVEDVTKTKNKILVT